ncbi:MAG: hypothetical protein LBH25_04395 [Fibromonadaceae bacterium]|nr:hypothetical protein [Fibromonadaceae bacterium]
MSMVEQHNKELEDLYKKVENDVLDKVDDYNKKVEDPDEKVAFPLFLKSYDEYESAEIKVMIFGKETNGWGDHRNANGGIYGRGVSIENVTSVYEGVFIDKWCYKYGKPFWNSVKNIINLLKEKSCGKKIGNSWNNIVKMGYHGKKKKFPESFYNEIVKPYFNNLIVKEIEILKPDYVIFLTGPDYEFVLNDVFSTPERKPIEGFKEKELCEIVIPNVKKSFRTYHPKYLFFNPIKKKSIFNKIVDEITHDCTKVCGGSLM